MVRMFLGTQLLFAILHSKTGLLTNAPSDKSLVLGGRAKLEEERSQMDTNRRPTMTKSLPWKLEETTKPTLPLYWIFVPIWAQEVQNKLFLSGAFKGRILQEPWASLPLPYLVLFIDFFCLVPCL